MADHGAICSQCGGAGVFGGSAYAYPGRRAYAGCDLCHGTGRNDGQSPTDQYVWAGPGIQIPRSALYIESDARQFADDAIGAEVEKYGRMIGGRVVMPTWQNGQPNYALHK